MVGGSLYSILFGYVRTGFKGKGRVASKINASAFKFANSEKKVLKERADLEMQITSQSDRAWIELLLMKKLGLVPEGYQKITFYEGEITLNGTD